MDKNNKPEDLFAKIMANYSRSEGSSPDYGTKQMAELFFSFKADLVKTGFTDEEAFTLTRTMVQSLFSNLIR